MLWQICHQTACAPAGHTATCPTTPAQRKRKKQVSGFECFPVSAISPTVQIADVRSSDLSALLATAQLDHQRLLGDQQTQVAGL
jgi:hypothetical protein